MADDKAAGAALPDFIPLAEAVAVVHAQTAPADATLPDAQRARLAAALSRLITIYTLAEAGTTARALSPHDLAGGKFIDGGAALALADGRPPIRGLAVTRTSLRAALGQLKRLR